MIARIKILHLTGPLAGTVRPTPFLTISGIQQVEDQGLFGMAFHPNYTENGFFYINYAVGGGGGASRVDRYRVSPTDPNLADPGSGTRILEFFKPFFNHNGDWLGFSPTDIAAGRYYLYHTTGDGGSNLDPQQLAQNLSKRNGKVLRVDVGADGLADDFPADPLQNFAVPPDNPFLSTPGADPTIWSRGLRNPWRASFDRLRGDLYIGNVGANLSDEVEFQAATNPGGDNYGWSRLEGTRPGPNPGPPTAADVFPMFECLHGGDLAACPKRSITGGYVYRGSVLELRGQYVFADFLGTYNFGTGLGRAQMFTAVYDGSDPATFDGTNVVGGAAVNRTTAFTPDIGTIDFVSSFGEDAAGEVYVVDMGNLGTPDGNGLGEIYKITGPDGLARGLGFAADGTTLAWQPVTDAAAYDLVRGDLDQLRATGDLGGSVLACVADDAATSSASDSSSPPPGGGFWYLARAVNASGFGGSWDSGGAGQVASRDFALEQSAMGCP